MGYGLIPLNMELQQDDRTVCCGNKIVQGLHQGLLQGLASGLPQVRLKAPHLRLKFAKLYLALPRMVMTRTLVLVQIPEVFWRFPLLDHS